VPEHSNAAGSGSGPGDRDGLEKEEGGKGMWNGGNGGNDGLPGNLEIEMRRWKDIKKLMGS
jgi:hypothetical protein